MTTNSTINKLETIRDHLNEVIKDISSSIARPTNEPPSIEDRLDAVDASSLQSESNTCPTCKRPDSVSQSHVDTLECSFCGAE